MGYPITEEDRRFIYAGIVISQIKAIHLQEELDQPVVLVMRSGLSHPAGNVK
jgi:hypothetical protein